MMQTEIVANTISSITVERVISKVASTTVPSVLDYTDMRYSSKMARAVIGYIELQMY